MDEIKKAKMKDLKSRPSRIRTIKTKEGMQLYTIDGKHFIDSNPVFGMACYELQDDDTLLHCGIIAGGENGMRWLQGQEPKKIVQIYSLRSYQPNEK